jgi:NAD kinase/nicotinic acid mononucleotide adenylyltransferase
MQSIIQRIRTVFLEAFGRTSLEERLRDIQRQANGVAKRQDLAGLRQGVGDLLASTLQLCNESGWDPGDLLSDSLDRIEERREVYQRLNRKQRVGLLRDDFNPISNHHLTIIQTVLASGLVDDVWLMPTNQAASGGTGCSSKDRIAMCRIAIQDLPNVRVWTYEQESDYRGECYHLIKRILGEQSHRDRVDFFWMIERGVADELQRTDVAERIDDIIPMIVLDSKAAVPPSQGVWYRKTPHRWLPMRVDESAVSSSAEICGLLARGDGDSSRFLPAAVNDYIREHGLYDGRRLEIPRARIAVYSESFSPPTLVQQQHVQQLLAQGFDRVIIHPRGVRSDRGEHEVALPKHRAALASLAFQDMPNVEINYDDISDGTSSPLLDLMYKYQSQGDVWLVVRQSDLMARDGRTAPILDYQEHAQRLWSEGKFAVLQDSERGSSSLGDGAVKLPPHYQCVRVASGLEPSELRAELYHGRDIRGMLHRDVADYIERHRLFLPGAPGRDARFEIHSPEIFVVCDERNPRAVELAQHYARYESNRPNMILVIGGDGTMLKAIREHWRRRLPFVGLNAGHLGFLMNASLPDALEGIELISQSLPLLRVDVRYPDGSHTMNLAYGDAWIERAEGQAAWLQVRVNGEVQLEKVVGDGMLIATAAGSSAYARAMGAVPVPLDSPSLILAGSNIFQPRFWRPMNLPSSSQITLTSLDTLGKRPLRAFIDGQPLGVVQELSAKQSLTASVELAFTKEYDPSTKLLKSLFPSES